MKVFSFLFVCFSFFSQPGFAWYINTSIESHIKQHHESSEQSDDYHKHSHSHEKSQEKHEHSHKHKSLVQIENQNYYSAKIFTPINGPHKQTSNFYVNQYISNPQPKNIFRPPIF